tara:strand:+ start:1201 stop:1596 length:396 start_codon:yes stop_codon:yes gene_type:complete
VHCIEIYLFRLDSQDDARFLLCLFEWGNCTVKVIVGSVFSCELIEVGMGSLSCDLCITAHFHPSVGIMLINQEQGHFGIGLDVPSLLSLKSRIDPYAFTIKVTPDDTRLWLTTRHHRREYCVDRFIQQVSV